MRTLRSLVTLPVALALALGACDPAPSATSVPTVFPSPVAIVSPTPQPTSTATARALPPPTPRPPVGVDVPAELDDIPWVTRDGETGVLTMGLLGQPASITRTGTDFRWIVRFAGPFIVIAAPDRPVEVLDARDGRTVTTWAWPEGFDPYFNLETDPAGEFLYFARWVDDVGTLMRLRLDGTDLMELTALGTGYSSENWHGGWDVRADGSIVVLHCPAVDRSSTTGPRCSLEEIRRGESDGSIRKLRLSTPPICRLQGATANHVFLTTTMDYGACFADGGFTPISSLIVDLDDLAFDTVPMDQGLYEGIGVVEIGPDKPRLVATAYDTPGVPNLFGPVGKLVNLRTGALKALISATDATEPGWLQWRPLRVIDDWVLVEGFGREYLFCRYESPSEVRTGCPPDTGGLWNAKTRELIRIPFGTYGYPSTIDY
jgi:hypothetical protein